MLRAHCWRVEAGRAVGSPRWSSRQELVVAWMWEAPQGGILASPHIFSLNHWMGYLLK